jgi:HEPN domain-containing protein
MEEQAWSDVVREAQELVELALKAMLREVGVDPPKWHDVGPILLEQSDLFPGTARHLLPELARISKWLRKEREFSFCGDIDLCIETDLDRDIVARRSELRHRLEEVFGEQKIELAVRPRSRPLRPLHAIAREQGLHLGNGVRSRGTGGEVEK